MRRKSGYADVRKQPIRRMIARKDFVGRPLDIWPRFPQPRDVPRVREKITTICSILASTWMSHCEFISLRMFMSAPSILVAVVTSIGSFAGRTTSGYTSAQGRDTFVATNLVAKLLRTRAASTQRRYKQKYRWDAGSAALARNFAAQHSLNTINKAA